MDLPLLTVLLIFLLGLFLGLKRPVVLIATVTLILGVLVAGNGFGEFVRTLLNGAFSLVT